MSGKIAVVQLSKNGYLMEVYPSATEAARSINSNIASISHCINGKQKSHKGYIWEKYGDWLEGK